MSNSFKSSIIAFCKFALCSCFPSVSQQSWEKLPATPARWQSRSGFNGPFLGKHWLLRHKPWPFQAHCQDNCGLSRWLQTVKTVADCQDSCRLSRQLRTVKVVADCQDNCTLSRADCQDNCWWLQTIKTTAHSCRPLHCIVTDMFFSIRYLSVVLKGDKKTKECPLGKCNSKNVDISCIFIPCLIRPSRREASTGVLVPLSVCLLSVCRTHSFR